MLCHSHKTIYLQESGVEMHGGTFHFMLSHDHFPTLY
jgi:hypothetical protein